MRYLDRLQCSATELPFLGIHPEKGVYIHTCHQIKQSGQAQTVSSSRITFRGGLCLKELHLNLQEKAFCLPSPSALWALTPNLVQSPPSGLSLHLPGWIMDSLKKSMDQRTHSRLPRYPSGAGVPQQSSRIPLFVPEKTQTESPHYNCVPPSEKVAGDLAQLYLQHSYLGSCFVHLSSHGCLPQYMLAVGSNPRARHHGFNFHNQQETV